MSTVPYHITNGKIYSLSYATPNREKFKEKCKTYSENNYITRTYELNNTVYCIYKTQSENFTFPSITETEPAVKTNPVLTYTFISLFTEISEKNSSFKLEKEPELEKIDSIVERVNWGGLIPSVSSQILSNFILGHPLPNANHRTSLGFSLLYLETMVDNFNLEKLPSDFDEIANSYISTSKQTLTVRRNTKLFKILENQGCKKIQRKNNVTITLDDFDLTVDDPYSFYSTEHFHLSKIFIKSLLNEVGSKNAVYEEGAGKSTFASNLLKN